MQASDPPDPRAVLGAVKARPGNAGASRKPSATAGLDRPCASLLVMSRFGFMNDTHHIIYPLQAQPAHGPLWVLAV